MAIDFETIELELENVAIECDVAGRGTRPLLLLHGLTGHRKDFELVLPELARHGRTLAPDLRGHGGSTHPGTRVGYDFETLVEDVRQMLDALEVECCDLLGHSFGGMLALRFALSHPERVASLVLMSTSCEAPDLYTREVFEKAGGFATSKGLETLQVRLEELGRREEVPLPGGATAEQRDWQRRYWDHHKLRILAMDPYAYGTLGIAMMDQEPVTQRLGEIACPTTVIIGREDAEFVRGAGLLAGGIAGAVTRALPGIGHQPQQEARTVFLEIMAEHLERVRSA
ncbi:MAG: alpha/beta hydrolase [bacterium]|nr:alpha/beta hydrolase [bacterium]